MGPVKGFVFDKVFTYNVGAHCHPATDSHFFPLGVVGNFHHFSMDPPMGVAYRIWFLWPWLGPGSRWPGWDIRPGSSGRGGTSLGAFSKGKLLWIHRPCCSRDRSVRSLDGLSFGQEGSHIWGQCRFTAQLIIYVESDLVPWFLLNWGGGPALPHPASGLLGPWL